MKTTTRPIQKTIYGEQSEATPNLYLLNWYYVANHGVALQWASSEEQAIQSHPYSGNKDVTWIATQIDPGNMPVVRMGKSMTEEGL